MSNPPANVVPITTSHQRDTEIGFRKLAEAAARGEIVGAGYTVIDRSGRTREGVLGMARANPALAHYGAARLASMLLWPDDEAGEASGR